MKLFFQSLAEGDALREATARSEGRRGGTLERELAPSSPPPQSKTGPINQLYYYNTDSKTKERRKTEGTGLNLAPAREKEK